MKKRLMKLFYILFIICMCWLIFAQSCMYFRTSDSAAQKDFGSKGISFKTEYYQVGNTNLHYTTSGNDSLPTLVFIHGSPGSWDAFTEYMKDSLLLLHYRMISIDRPGFGYSDFGKAMDMAGQAVVINELLKHIDNGKPVCLIGHSLGGPLVIKLAAENKEVNIAYLVILAGSVDPAEEKPENWRKTLDRTPLRYFVPGAMRPSNAELLLFKQDVYDLEKDFPNVTCDVLIMHGDKDDFVPPGNADYAKEKLIHAKTVRIVWFEGQRHFIPWTKFKEIREELLQLNMK